MKIKNSFEVPLPVEEAWKNLLDIPSIAPCMPGARLLGVEDDSIYTGEVAVRLGPVLLSFKGRAEVVAKDPVAKTAQVRAQGRDAKGRGSANADVAFHLVEQANGTRVEIETNLNLSGAVAQYGRGAGMITDLSNHLIGEFARNLEAKFRSEKTIAPGAAEPVVARADPDAEPARSARPAAQPGSSAAPLSGFKLLGVLVRSFLTRLFGRISGRSGSE